MKNLFKIITISMFLIGTTAIAQNPDQNPNYKESEAKYTKQKDELVKTHGETVQETYEDLDFREKKALAKEEKIQRRHEIRILRQQRHNRAGYGVIRDYDNNYYDNGYNNDYNYNNGYNYSRNRSRRNWGRTALGTAILGTTLYYIFK